MKNSSLSMHNKPLWLLQLLLPLFYCCVQEMKSELAYLAHRCSELDKYRVETCCIIGELVNNNNNNTHDNNNIQNNKHNLHTDNSNTSTQENKCRLGYYMP